MKRGAERQISKDDCDKDEGQEDSPQIGFQKADDSVLATRPIRGLPKRASVAAVPVPIGQTSSAKFAGFSGFGGGSNSFSGFSTTTTSTSSPALFFTPTGTTPTNTAKSLTSLLASTNNPPTPVISSENSASPSLSASPFGTPPAAPSSPSVHKDEAVDPAELKYYTSLRGLNESLRAAVGRAIDDDPFADITVFLERYKSLRIDIQKDFNGKAASPSPSAAAAPNPAPIIKAFTMPVPSKDGFTFGGKNVSNLPGTKPETSTTTTGFVPTPPTSSIFGVSSDKTTKSDAPSTSLPVTFGVKPTETTALADTSASSLFLQIPAGGSKDKNTTASSSSLNPSAPSKPPAPITFGSRNPTTNSLSPSFTFGAGSSSSFTLTTPSTTAPAGESTAYTTGRFAGFLGFVNPTKTAPSFDSTTPLVTPSTTPSLSLGLAPTSSSLTATASGSSGNGDAGDDAPQKNIAESFALNADNKHDQEGAGEEDEETMHAVKLKAYVMKDDKGTKSWVELGYGVLRIKKHKETSSRRVLLRSSSTGQILVNFSFHSAFKPTQKGKNVTFLGHDTEGVSKMYTLKLQTPEQATSLANAFDREIKAKDGSS